LLVEAVTKAAHLNVRNILNATDGVLNPALFQLRDELFIGDVLRFAEDIA
jgi:hypothetical protein